jgi:hypothetical protein
VQQAGQGVGLAACPGTGSGPGRPGLVLGYAASTPTAIAEGVAVLAAVAGGG